MAVDMPDLDQSNRGSMRTMVFPLALSESSMFLAVVLLASCHYSAVSRNVGVTNLLRLKQEALESINQALPCGKPSDALIGSVAKMASYEAMYGGSIQVYQAHMAGLERMIEMRGGLSSLGLGGLLRRLILWIDLNSSYLLKLPLHFPDEIFAESQPTILPDLGHFVGAPS
jgi:hypothetical protein